MAEDDHRLDDRYASFREHAELQRAHSALEATVTNQLNNMSGGISDIKSMLLRPPPPPVDHNALVSHRVIQELPQTLSQALATALQDARQHNGNATSPFTLVLSYVGIAAIAGFAVYFFLHH